LRRLATVAVLASALACTGRPPPAEPLVALHDASGAMTLALAREGAGHRYWDLRARRDAAVTPLEPLAGRPGGVRWPSGAGLVLERVDGALRVGDARGVPRARVVRDGEAFVLGDAGGVPLARAARAGGRVTITDRDGRALGFVSGAGAPGLLERAALSALPELSPAERAAVLVASVWP
jgi:hypothetical protein